MNFTSIALIFLCAMVISVPIAKRLGLASVLAYLLMGVTLGPSALGILSQGTETILHFAEFGVIMMLFLIGLELQPRKVWAMRGPIFGVGGAQVILTTLFFMVATLSLGGSYKTGLAIGMILALSSTALVMQILEERGLLKSIGGENAFAILLFQDLAVIPMVALLPLLGDGPSPSSGQSDHASTLPDFIAHIPTPILWIGSVFSIILAGKVLMKPLFRMIAHARLRELYTATALLIVLATSGLMVVVGLSPALGAFLAGVVLADSEYRHQLEADIEPFKALLLAVFFISIGATLDLGVLWDSPVKVILSVLGLFIVKGIALFAIGKIFRLKTPDQGILALGLSQGGEFAFVLLTLAGQQNIFSPELLKLMSTTVALSMILAPLVFMIFSQGILPRLQKQENPKDVSSEHNPTNEKSTVLIAGFGRFGQGVGRFLRANGISVTLLDFDADQIELMKRLHIKAYYGDVTRMELLEAAGAKDAKILVIAINDAEATTEMIDQVRHHFPHLKILCRAFDRLHAYELLQKGVESVKVETAGSSLWLGMETLKTLGFRSHYAYRAAELFRAKNKKSIIELSKVYGKGDEGTFLNHARSWLSQLEKLLEQDLAQHDDQDLKRAWESAPRKK